MKYCKRCLYPENHPYGIIFDEDGVCSGCRIHEEKDKIDWDKRFQKLNKIIDTIINSSSKKSYDCVVPVSGGGDSYFVVDVVKNKLGLNPLLVNYNIQYNTKVGIRNLANLTTVFDCDMISSTLSPELVKKVTRHTLKHYGSMYWHVLAGQSTFPVQTAVKFRIPLIIWGLNGWSDQTGMYSHLDNAEMTERCRNEHNLFGVKAIDILRKSNEITSREILNFTYPNDRDIERVGVRGIYLSNFIRWDSKSQHEKMINLYGYETCPQQRTYNSYEDVHCKHSAGIHDYIKFIKYGYSKVTDHACKDIRLRRLEREKGIDLVKKYTFVEPKDLDIFLDWVNLTRNQFYKCIWERRDLRIWEKTKKGKWILKDNISNHLNDEEAQKNKLSLTSQNCNYINTTKSEFEDHKTKYILMGRVYIDKKNYGSIKDRPKDGFYTQRKWEKPSIKKDTK
ncbi:N-acetyl sugar amidotransferase [Prochlorococcus sp. AH-736-E15]|nr:N-acetyl sugar amidotransferase [Prochlorococcus sp. AH-736-E15]